MSRIPLGVFELIEPVARGGMAEVWRARHAPSKTPVAVKVISGEAARHEAYRSLVRNEVRAAARLDHPGIALVLDQGQVTSEAEARSGGRLAAGAPYLVMEWASGGTLAKAPPVHGWGELREILLALLDALGHAHARGVIHRDLKPGNVLLCTGDDARPGLKLSDFGIAHPVDRAGQTADWGRRAIGTIYYMAPEQMLGRWRDQGPWTDLYALGCLTWRLVTGKPPFPAKTADIVAMSHLRHEPPPLIGAFPLTDGFQAWARSLMEKHPRDRFQRAADAAWALRALDGEVAVPVRMRADERAEVGADVPTVRAIDTFLASPVRPPRTDARTPPAAPLPAAWRTAETARRPQGLHGAGLGLLGVRTVPLVGREPERDALWGALATVHRTGQPRLAVIEGPGGVGKTRLAEWLCERAHEVGAATVIAVRGADDPIASAVESLLRCTGLRRADVRERVDEFLDDWGGAAEEEEALALTELVRPAGPDDPPTRVRLERAGERHAVVRRLVERLATERPVLLRVEDAGSGPDALALVEHLLSHRWTVPTPLLVLLTTRDGGDERIEALLRAPDALRFSLRRLGPADRERLVRGVLQLDEGLAARVEERTAGNPLFAIELVADWARRGLLVPGPRGFALTQPVQPLLPDSLHETWRRVIHGVVGGDDDAAACLERAAALGEVVDDADWEAACGRFPRCGTPASRAEVVERLLARRLAEPLERGWRFAHAPLRESLERLARDAERWEAHHRACAAVLGARGASGERIGLHLLAAGDVEAALDPLLGAVADRERTQGTRAARSLLRTCEEAMTGLGLPATDPRWARLWVARSVSCRVAGELTEARRAAMDAIEVAWKGDRALLREAMLACAEACFAAGALDEARPVVAELVAITSTGDAPSDRGRALLCQAAVVEPAAGDPLREAAVACFEAAGDDLGLGFALRDTARALLVRDGDAAAALFERGARCFERVGSMRGQADCAAGLAEVSRLRGELAQAEASWRRALALYEASGNGEAALVRMNLAVLALLDTRYADAQALAEASLAGLEHQRWERYMAGPHAVLLARAAALARWATFDDHLRRCREWLVSSPWSDRDLAWLFRHAAEIARRDGEEHRARAAYLLSEEQWRAIGEEERALDVARVRDRGL